MKETPELINYSSIHHFEGKIITVNEKETLQMFPVQRIYWIHYNCPEPTNSMHAHKTLQQVVIAMHGVVTIELESPDGRNFRFILNNPSVGLYIPPMYWKKIAYSEPCTLLCLASEEYREEDYIRDYTLFKQTVMQ